MTEKQEQHYRLTLEQAISHYQSGELTAKGALKFYFLIRLKPGWECHIHPKKLQDLFGMKRSTFWSAMNTLVEEGFLNDWQERQSLVVSLGCQNSGQSSKILDSHPENGTAIQNSGQPSEILDEELPKPLPEEDSTESSDSSQISFKSYSCVEQNFENSKISEITHTEILRNSEEEDLPENVISIKKHWENQIELSDQPKFSGKDRFSGQATSTIKYDAALGMRPPAPKPKYLIPAGDWLNERGQLDPGFVRHTAKQWQKSEGASFHKMPIEEVEALVFSHFAKNHDALAVKWEAYTKVSTRHAEAVKLRLDAGISIPEAEQAEIIGKSQAIASNLAALGEEQIISDPEPAIKLIQEQTTQEVLVILDRTESEAPQENSQAYLPYQPQEFTEFELRQNLKRLSSLSSAIKGMPSAEKERKTPKLWPETITEANNWLRDVVLKSQAVTWAKKMGFMIDFYNDQPIEIYEF